jgi:predicted ATPase/DNA-binding SARP family transcriptional activator
VEFRILGPLEIASEGGLVQLRAAKHRALLAVLLLHANQVVSYGRLLDELWGEEPPATAIKTLQVYVAALRKALGSERIVSRARGYLLRAEADEVDAARFELLVGDAQQLREAGAAAEAAERFREALSLWRGAALADVSFESLARGEVERLEELRLTVLAERIECELLRGRHGDVIGELEALVSEHPLHERFRGQLMLALYRNGRQAEALETFHDARRTLVEELGIEPGLELQDLNRRMLKQDPELEVASGSRPLPSGTVTLVATEVEGSAQLLQELGQRYADVLDAERRLLREAFSLHGGREIEWHGDSFLHAFTSVREAVAAAAEAQRRAVEHEWPDAAEVRVRVGIHTGEPALVGERYVGLDVHRVAQIRSASHGGQILVSREARALLGELPAGMALRDLGAQRLRDVEEPERLFQLTVPGLRDVFPPPRGLHATNIAVPASSFVGRERELADLRRLLLDPKVRLVSLTGPGGSGKSRLAIEIASSLLPTFPDGAFVVLLAPIAESGHVLPAIARALSVKEVPGRPLAETLERALAVKELLLLLDNFEHLLAAAVDVATLLDGCPRLKLLVTSRAPLRLSAEHLYEVPPLSLPDLMKPPDPEILLESEAVRLFVERAKAVKPAFEFDGDSARQAAEICARVDGLPLALELAAARMSVLSPAALLARLDGRLATLSVGARDRPARQQTLRATLDWSYDLLDSSEQTLLNRLSVFAGGCRIEAAEAICDPDAELEIDIFEGLSSLVEKSLVRQEEMHQEPRFSLLETMREYALERLEQEGATEALRRRHAVYYLEIAAQTAPKLGDPDQKLWLDRLETDHDNLRAALAWLRDTGEHLAHLRMATVLMRFWFNNDHLVEGRRWLESALRAAPDAPPPLRARALAAAAELTARTGDPGAARPLALEALALAREVDDHALVARMLQMQAVAAGMRGDFDAAVALCEQALEELPTDTEPQFRARSRFMLSRFEHRRGNLTRARGIYEELSRDAREAGDTHLIAATLSGFADIALEEGDPTKARQLHAESLTLCRRIGSKAMSGERLAALAATAAARAEPGPAGRLWGALEALQQQLGVASSLPPWLPDYEARISTVAGEAFEKARDAGHAMELDEAIEYALSTAAHDGASRRN